MAEPLEGSHVVRSIGRGAVLGTVLGIVAWALQFELEFGLMPVVATLVSALLVVWLWPVGEKGKRRFSGQLAATTALLTMQFLLPMLLMGQAVRHSVQMTWRDGGIEPNSGEAVVSLEFVGSPGSSLAVYSTRLLEDLRRRDVREVQVEFEGYQDVGCPRMLRPLRIEDTEFTPAGRGFGPLKLGIASPFPSPWWCD